MKDYFISFEFWADRGSIDKFLFCCVKVDLSEVKPKEVALHLINEHFPDVDTNTVTIKVIAFNLV
jgi:hypothetical protein